MYDYWVLLNGKWTKFKNFHASVIAEGANGTVEYRAPNGDPSILRVLTFASSDLSAVPVKNELASFADNAIFPAGSTKYALGPSINTYERITAIDDDDGGVGNGIIYQTGATRATSFADILTTRTLALKRGLLYWYGTQCLYFGAASTVGGSTGPLYLYGPDSAGKCQNVDVTQPAPATGVWEIGTRMGQPFMRFNSNPTNMMGHDEGLVIADGVVRYSTYTPAKSATTSNLVYYNKTAADTIMQKVYKVPATP